jgi:hypothetical protein
MEIRSSLRKKSILALTLYLCFFIATIGSVAYLVVEAVVPGLPGTFTSEFEDEWVFIDGLWYHGGDRS